MSDFLLELSQNRTARKAIKSLGLPLPLPQKLRRAKAAYEDRPLENQSVIVGTAAGARLEQRLADVLCRAGANPLVVGELGSSSASGPWAEAAQAWGRPAKSLALASLPSELRADALVFDATGIDDPSDLRALYDFFHPLLGHLSASGRVVVLGRAPESLKDVPAAAAQRGLSGFIRSLGREVGRKGATANLLYVSPEAEERVEGPLRFLLSSRSAFVSGQVLTVGNGAKQPARQEPRWTRPLDGKVALVTGAARGIGAATARRLAQEGARVVVLDRPADDQLASQLARELGGSVLLADISDADAPARIAEELERRFGGVDLVVHNAGITRDKTLARMKPELWDQAVAVNLGAVVRITDALIERRLLRDGGRVICLSSVSGIAGNMGQTNYSASKAGLIGFVELQAKALASRGITVNAIAPGFIETRLTEAMPVMIREVARRLSNLGQGGLPEDVAEAITFLSTPGASGITGGVLRVCGGAYVGA